MYFKCVFVHVHVHNAHAHVQCTCAIVHTIAALSVSESSKFAKCIMWRNAFTMVEPKCSCGLRLSIPSTLSPPLSPSPSLLSPLTPPHPPSLPHFPLLSSIYPPLFSSLSLKGSSLLHSFAMFGCYEVVKLLWERGVRPTIHQADNTSLLHSAVRTQEGTQDEERARILRFFLVSGECYNNSMPLDLQNSQGWTALKLAARKNLEKCVEVLIDHDANPDLPDHEAYTALHNAVGNPDILKMLSTKSKNLEAQNKDGETPLYLAAERGLVESALMLLEYGADPNTPNKEGACQSYSTVVDFSCVESATNGHVCTCITCTCTCISVNYCSDCSLTIRMNYCTCTCKCTCTMYTLCTCSTCNCIAFFCHAYHLHVHMHVHVHACICIHVHVHVVWY